MVSFFKAPLYLLESYEIKEESVESLKSVILESKKLRAERGEDFYNNKKNSTSDTLSVEVASKIHSTEKNYQSTSASHIKLAQLISEYDKKIFDQNNQVLATKKTRSKSIHLYVDETIEHFLNTEAKKAESKWGLRKNAGLGQLIQKFILNFIELKKREERQLKKVRKLIDDFRSNLVEFKNFSSSADEYFKAEQANQKMKILSNDLRILLSLLEFEEEELKVCLGSEIYSWLGFVIQWKFHT